jgi:drug/metabolite transporter (DMT)-like permease
MLSNRLLGEKVSVRQWIALVLGLFGVGLVLAPRLMTSTFENVTIANIFFSFAALFGITLGTIYQKAFVSGEDVRTSSVFQYTGAAILVGMGAFFFETMTVEWSIQFVGALSWLVVVLSLVAIGLLLLIIRHGDVSRVATMFYMVPPVTAMIAFLVFDERLTGMQLMGMVITVYAVWFANRVR